MYDYIKGTITAVTPEYIVVEAGQIGYSIITGNPFSFSALEGKETKVYLYQNVREDSLTLFGFKTLEERFLFKKLLSVSGIGPKSALAIVASGDAAKLISAIEAEDDVFLTKFPSVGKKTARQIILDLKGKLGDVAVNEIHIEPVKQELTDGLSPELEEALLALQALGYSDRELKKVLPKLKEEKLSSDEAIKLALRLMTS
ncbi:Holliday junction branch migration protein RuvA [Listeria aquatica]|uniref:Holliday junction branch migration complex subunit RuvA n=1 Tax=Listeria aquatica FSL S10-1188 TaxID=1265818 RepID=W7AQZ7_9LIST|nr:Holliday junction branch migration protein RuvA [Listeria aquatica]EUJ17604.1 Holliday junction DNA helicase RuvA [Listeria aquatica FSL S10-1188]